jgi:hypothetical protein
MKKLFSRMRPTSQKGQSLVEMAITAPILIFMLIGVFEVGWALRGYLVLTNVNREITRFAIRPGYLNYSIRDSNSATSAATIGYDKVLSYTYSTLSDQLPLNFSTGQTSTLIISHLVVDTGIPCVNMATCDCNQFVTNPNFYISGANVLTRDDLILHPQTPTYNNYYVYTFPLTSAYRTQLNYPALAAQLARENNKFNCELMKKSTGTIPSANNVIVTELYFNQPQLFGFPIIANPYTNPVPMYTHTTMRMIVASRSGENVDTVGPVCEAFPFSLNSTPAFTTGNQVDILGPGFLKWNSSAASNQAYLTDELNYSRMALNNFRDASDGDTTLSVTDRVAILTGGPYTGVFTNVQALIGKSIRVPIGSGNPFVVSGFAWVQIQQAADINIATSQITATYVGNAAIDSAGNRICPLTD